MAKGVKLILFSSGCLVLSSLVLFQVHAAPPVPNICGDGIIKSPNNETPAKYEKCDDQKDTDRCTGNCGQKMLGWGWSYNFGWFSLNTKTCDFLDPAVPSNICGKANVTYYTQIDENNQVRGFAWSNNLGWICFGQTCDPENVCEFAKAAGYECDGNDYGILKPPGGEWQAYIENDQMDNSPVLGWAKILALGDRGLISLSCSGCSHPYQTILVSKDFKYQSDGIDQRLTLKGWAWNDTPDGFGLGWIEFNPEISTISPWLQTKYGDIYSLGGLTSTKESPDYNATYQILSGGDIVNFRSARQLVDPYSGVINFPTSATRYSNVLGKLDVNGLICSFSGLNNTCINQYGKTVIKQPLTSIPSQTLEGKIYYYNGSTVIDQPLSFKNGIDFSNGSGTIIVNGNLTINSNVTYFCDDAANKNNPACLSTKFRNLASVAWIVKGDLFIGPNVEKMVGNFIVIGDGKECDSQQNVKVNYCGQVYSCYNSTDCSKRLTVFGLIMGKKFYFDRTYVSPADEVPKQGSEVINYDGRLLANTPPGLGDFVQALPVWRQGATGQ